MIDTTYLRRQQPEPTDEHTLLDESFTAGDARDLVRALADAAANVHKLRNLRCYVHSHDAEPPAARSLRELEVTHAELEALLDAARAEGRRVRLRTTIELELTPGQRADWVLPHGDLVRDLIWREVIDRCLRFGNELRCGLCHVYCSVENGNAIPRR